MTIRQFRRILARPFALSQRGLIIGLGSVILAACGGGGGGSSSDSPVIGAPSPTPTVPAIPTVTPPPTSAPVTPTPVAVTPTPTPTPGTGELTGPKLKLDFNTSADVTRWTADDFGDNVKFTHEHDAAKRAFKLTPNWSTGSAGQGYSYIVATDKLVTADGARIEIDLELPEQYVSEDKLEINLVSQMNQTPWSYNFVSYKASDLVAGMNKIVFEKVTPKIFTQNGADGALFLNQRFGISLASNGSVHKLPLYIHRVSVEYPDSEAFEPTGETGELERPIIVDQFGYQPSMKKVAVIKDPQTGNDSRANYTPGEKLQVVKSGTTDMVLEGAPVIWKNGLTDDSSGDKAWHFDFTALTTPGDYEILDPSTGKRSYEFSVSEDVYKSALKDAVRTFFYQRAGFEKAEAYAGVWADAASHAGPGQDTQARLYSASGDASTEKDLSGGWYDAGDYNKYTQWTARYVLTLLHTYKENQELWDSEWGDNFGIPESGNDTADLLDEIKWGMDHLLRLQNADGSVLSIVDLSHDTPASKATGRSLYGPANTSTTFMTAAAYAYGAKVWAGDTAYAATLKKAAEDAWTWGVANPEVVWQNALTYDTPTGQVNSGGIGAGRQECGIGDNTSLYEANFVLRQRCKDFIQTRKLFAAMYLSDLTGTAMYTDYVNENYTDFSLFARNYLSEYEAEESMAMKYYANSANAAETTATAIDNALKNGINSSNYTSSYTSTQDPYLAYLQSYTWGSNAIKASKGNTYLEATVNGELSGTQLSKDEIKSAAAGYIHYIHGVNPWGINMLSNMDDRGAENSVDEFYHEAYYVDKDPKYNSKVGIGPAPGFLVGGANPSHKWDGCCWTKTCNGLPDGGAERCGDGPPMPPMFQPAQKSFAEDGRGWPLNNWSVTENSNSYQVQYIRLLSKYVQ